MRLNSIKLSGFKSFADATHFQLPGQLVGVVGPNGCGKSNIMDAVRWVLGESKASELRGESMQDVIFNGSGNRRPAGRASVELVFDNSLARAGGSWNQYAEIAVRRVLTRDGQSQYFINGQGVRRRDVQDVFLGTGLGPRAYAIIGQGTISRIIESRPEELRLFLEEAAGVSKYKERRRETEHRLRDTRDNLTRVEDILRELASQLERLEAQAAVALRYRALQDAGTLRLHQLWFLRHRDAAGEQRRVREAALAAATALEARTAELREVEAVQEHTRQDHHDASDALHAAQGGLAEAAMQVSRLEERIRHVLDARQRGQQRLAEAGAQRAQWASRQAEAEAELARLADQIDAAQAAEEELAARLEDQAGELPAAEDAWRQAAHHATSQRARVAEVQQQIQLLAAQSRNLDERRRELETRRERLAGERRQLAAPDTRRLDELREQLEQSRGRQAEADARLSELASRVPALEEQRRERQHDANRQSARLAEVAARLEALRALQEKVQAQGRLRPWLARHGLDGLPGLWRRIHVETGWETALEAALRERMNALEVGRLDTVRAFEGDPPPAKLVFHASPGSVSPRPAAAAGLQGLAARLKVEDAGLRTLLADWLEGVHTAPDLTAALAARGGLAHGEVIVTPQGHAVSAWAVAFHAPDSEQAGLLARAQEIEHLAAEARAQALIADEARAALVRAEAACTDASQQLSAARREAAEGQTRAHQLQVEVLRLSQQAEQVAGRRGQIDAELAEIDAQQEDLEERRMTGEARFEELDLMLADAQETHASREDAVIAAERRLAGVREQARALERAAQEAQFAARALVARRDEQRRGQDTARQQVQAAEQAEVLLREEIASFDDAAAGDGLQEALALRLAREQALAAARARYDDLALRLRQADERRAVLERGLQPMREEITRLQLEEQAASLGGAQFLEQLRAAGADLEALAAGIERDGVRLHGLQAEIDRVHKELNALGAVNLAALDELGAARERKGFLDAQHADLLDAMQTLEEAIRRIDAETRELLQSTFDRVDEGFGTMFPSLFGGGQARLVMTGDEILDAGVQVMAQPPGKKNSTIHLLSGGEKALTAIALVFAIFQLNPAPFCLLDEVDAPLDDANTERYARLVKRMSAGTQFLFISHNKIAMEMAEQLVGVTMQEQGVSRIVAVDMEAAVSMAEA